ncbi:MAG: phosphotransferase [Actinobacteria bacterium]|uniref:Unannotated protein n=1 Tax=freshwater metagenome TaxID=449393 RepID=A0A6J6RN43_9ZZZZ|nr:phosphotransferase [Actinomycetota bacterium]
MSQTSWRDPAWVVRAHAWIEDRLAELGVDLLGEIEQPHVEAWSTVLRAPTSQGSVWFKVNDTSLRHEAAVVTMLSERCPDSVPPLLAADLTTGWMLMSDAGTTLRALVEQDPAHFERWHDALRRCAVVQREVVGEVDALLALGVPDLRLATLPRRYADLIADLDVDPATVPSTAEIEAWCAGLAAYGLPETLQHDDLHDAQVFVSQGRTALMDWGDACVSHPFFVLSVALEGVIAWGPEDIEASVDTGPYLDSYLEPWSDLLPADELRLAARAAVRLGWACRAVNGHVPGDVAATRTRLGMLAADRI